MALFTSTSRGSPVAAVASFTVEAQNRLLAEEAAVDFFKSNNPDYWSVLTTKISGEYNFKIEKYVINPTDILNQWFVMAYTYPLSPTSSLTFDSETLSSAREYAKTLSQRYYWGEHFVGFTVPGASDPVVTPEIKKVSSYLSAIIQEGSYPVVGQQLLFKVYINPHQYEPPTDDPLPENPYGLLSVTLGDVTSTRYIDTTEVAVELFPNKAYYPAVPVFVKFHGYPSANILFLDTSYVLYTTVSPGNLIMSLEAPDTVKRFSSLVCYLTTTAPIQGPAIISLYNGVLEEQALLGSMSFVLNQGACFSTQIKLEPGSYNLLFSIKADNLYDTVISRTVVVT